MAAELSVTRAGRGIGSSKIGLARAGGRRRPNLRILIGGGILTIFVVIAVVAPLIAPYDPLMPDPARSLAPPSAAHPLGNDEFGRDVLSRLIFGARISIEVSIASIALALGVGTLAGLLAGYFGGLVDWIVMRTAWWRSSDRAFRTWS
jgi:peptide/nickel transport system permease protein